MERKQPKWEKGQSVLHKKDFIFENTYGSLKFVKENSNHRQVKKGFVLEAKEAPGTSLHTEKEKHLEFSTAKKVRLKEEHFLYASEIPLQNQAIFYDIAEWHKSRELIECIKYMLETYGHRTLKDTFGFLDQTSERLQKQILEQERRKDLSLEEFELLNKQIDILGEHLRKKESKEQQMCAELQLMIDREKEKEKKINGNWKQINTFEKDKKENDKEDETEDEIEDKIEKRTI